MPTFRAFAYNTGSTISGTDQLGSIAIGTTTLGGNVVWWAGPDEDLGYVVAESVSGGTMTGANGQPAFLGFYRSSDLTSSSFIALANYLANGVQTFTSGLDAKTWLNNNGYWTSYVTNSATQISFNVTSDNGAYIDYTGKLFMWGNAGLGRNGYNSTISSNSPRSVCGRVKTFCKIDVGSSATFAIDKYGKIWSWGFNSGGALGGGSGSSTPRSIGGANKTFCSVGGGSQAQVGLDKYGQVWGWGYNFRGQVGNNSATTAFSTPVSVCGAKKTFCKIEATNERNMAIDQYGQVWGWGANNFGEIGNRSTVSYSTPVSICGAKKTFCEISGSLYVSLGLDKNGQVWSWGNAIHGNNVGTGTYSTPVSICGVKKTFCQISRGGGVSAGIDQYGKIWLWGTSNAGLLGNNVYINNNVLTPRSICGANKTFCQISIGNQTGLAVDKYGILWAWGSNQSGGLGVNRNDLILSPKSICGAIKTFCQLTAFGTTGIVIDKNGKVWGWGSNFNGTLGNNSATNVLTPISICGANKTFCQIGAGNSYATAIDKNGRAWSWGSNLRGQLGNNSTQNFSTPISVAGAIKTFCAIAVSSETSFGIDKNGRLWAWGMNSGGDLGNNSVVSQRTPVSVCGAVKTFCKISGPVGSGPLSIDKNGLIWGWGSGNAGILGNNSIVSYSTPVSICGATKTFCDVKRGATSVGLDTNGKIWVWGLGTNGIGNNSSTTYSTPVSVCGQNKTFCKISSYDHKLAIDKYGRIWAWGSNSSGQLGDGTQVNRCTPVLVCAQNKTFCNIITNASNSYAVDKNGQLWAWGAITSVGSTGTNEANFIATPVKVCGF